MITSARFEELALSLEGAYAVPHFDRKAFRTPRRIFATLPPGGESANLLLDLDAQAAACEARPKVFSPVPGGWGRMGYTTVDLRAVTEADLRRALAEAHARASEPPARKKKPPRSVTAKKASPAASPAKPRAKKKNASSSRARPATKKRAR